MKQHHIHQLIEDGERQAIRTGRDVLISAVMEASVTDLPSIFSITGDRFYGNRFFWSEPGRELAFAGLGDALTIASDDRNDRFRKIEQSWREITESCLVAEDIPAYTGPHLFGGFSFDPLRPRSDEWRHYPHSRFVLPEIMLTEYRGRTWITLNQIISSENTSQHDPSRVDQLTERWTEMLAHLNTSLKQSAVDSGPSSDRLSNQSALDSDPSSDRLSNQSAVSSGPSSDRSSNQPSNLSTGRILQEEIAPGDWMKAVGRAARSVRAGEIQKIVLARQLRLYAERDFDVSQILERLLQEQDNTYVFAIESGQDCFVGATPERLMKSQGEEFKTLSLAGSIGRGNTESEDRELGDFLFHDVKNIHEHQLAVDMIKEAMIKLCTSVQVPNSPILYKLKDIQHLLTPIVGQAKEGATLLQAIEALHPTPALGGMPQDDAIEAIRKLENMDRGWYAAPIGWLNRSLDGEFAAAIRSALIQGREASLYAGCGIVGDSDPRSEYQETALKFRPMLSALGALDTDD